MKKMYKIQILRAFSIIAVVLIHTCPSGNWQVICRPFINFSVAVFLFLSGYLTKIENDNWLLFYKKRIIRVIIPYLIWSVLYSILNFIEIKQLILNLLTTNSAVTLYYIYVYIQFVLLTPIFGKIAKTKYKWSIFLITPISILFFKYYYLLTGLEMNEKLSIFWNISCLGWVTYYYLGLLLGNKLLAIKCSSKKLIVLYIFSILLQMIEGYYWLQLGEVNCGTQLKITSLITSSLSILICYFYLTNNKIKINNKLLILIGDFSFGIYLNHIMIMIFLNKIPIYQNLPYIVNSIIALLISLLSTIIVRKILGKRISKYIGFI